MPVRGEGPEQGFLVLRCAIQVELFCGTFRLLRNRVQCARCNSSGKRISSTKTPHSVHEVGEIGLSSTQSAYSVLEP